MHVSVARLLGPLDLSERHERSRLFKFGFWGARRISGFLLAGAGGGVRFRAGVPGSVILPKPESPTSPPPLTQSHPLSPGAARS